MFINRVGNAAIWGTFRAGKFTHQISENLRDPDPGAGRNGQQFPPE
jgi:hypothetical protein